jgi:hypothetical protein
MSLKNQIIRSEKLARSPSQKDFLAETLEKNYRNFPDIERDGTFMEDVGVFVQLSNLFRDFHGKNILDVGCGATESADGESYTPNLARLLSFTNSNVFGIDIGQSLDEPYTHLVADLKYQKIANIVPSGIKFDAVISQRFFSSPSLFEDYFSKNKPKFEYGICKEINDSLKEDGRFFTDLDFTDTSPVSCAGFKLEKPAQKILVSRSGVEGSRERPLDLSQFVKSDFFL